MKTVNEYSIDSEKFCLKCPYKNDNNIIRCQCLFGGVGYTSYIKQQYRSKSENKNKLFLSNKKLHPESHTRINSDQ